MGPLIASERALEDPSRNGYWAPWFGATCQARALRKFRVYDLSQDSVASKHVCVRMNVELLRPDMAGPCPSLGPVCCESGLVWESAADTPPNPCPLSPPPVPCPPPLHLEGRNEYMCLVSQMNVNSCRI